MRLKTLLKELMQRHKNPVSMGVEITAFVLLCISLWIHDLILISVSVVTLSIGWFVLPKPKRRIKYISNFVEWEIKWFGSPAHCITAAFGLIIALSGFWFQNINVILLGTGLMIIVVLRFSKKIFK